MQKNGVIIIKTCNNCIYQKLCDAYASLGVTDFPADDTTACELHEDKELFFKLPCKPGDTLYGVRYYASTNNKSVYSFKAPDVKWIFDFAEEFGKSIFLTLEEADEFINKSYSEVTDCEYLYNGFCTCSDCPLRADYCPTSSNPEICKYAKQSEEVNK